MKRASWEIIRYAPGTGSIPEGDAAAFGGWYADREDAKAQYKMDHSHCPAGEDWVRWWVKYVIPVY
jgi:hypothetical protein